MRIPFRHGETILHLAARKNWTALCQWLLRFGVDVNRTDVLGKTALHYAAQHGATDAVQLLIEQGADFNALDWKERTPLMLAEGGHSEGAAMMLREEISLRDGQRIKGLKVLRHRTTK